MVCMIVDVVVLRYLFWNAALVLLFVYGIQGIAVLWHLVERRVARGNPKPWLAAALGARVIHAGGEHRYHDRYSWIGIV